MSSPRRNVVLLGMVLMAVGCGSSDNEVSAGTGGAAGLATSAGAAGMSATNAGTAGVGPGGSGGNINGGAAGSITAVGGGSGGVNQAGTAGAMNGGASNGGQGAGGTSTGSCLPNYLLCEDFEGTALGVVPEGWTAHGDASVADDEAHAGQRALKVSPAQNGERRVVHDASMLGSQHWGRVYYKVQLPVPEAFVHSTLVSMHGIGPTVGEAEFRFVDTVKDQATGGFAMGNHQFLFNVQPNGAEFGMGTNYDYTFDGEWHCVEWHVDAADQSFAFYYEGEDVLNFTHGAGNFEDSELPDGFDEVRVGWNNYQGAPPGFTAWLDDFALAEERINCLP